MATGKRAQVLEWARGGSGSIGGEPRSSSSLPRAQADSRVPYVSRGTSLALFKH